MSIRISTIAGALAAVAIAACLASPTPLEAQRETRTATASAEQRRAAEYAAILDRASALPRVPQTLTERNVREFNARRAALRTELGRWATAYDFELVARKVPAEPPADAPADQTTVRVGRTQTGTSVSCEDSMEIDGMQCMLAGLEMGTGPNSGTYQCVYECAKPKQTPK